MGEPRTYQTCPKCNGQKHVNTPPWVPGDQQTYSAISTGSYQCPICRGFGKIERPITPTPSEERK